MDILIMLKDYVMGFLGNDVLWRFLSGLILVLFNWGLVRLINLSKRADHNKVLVMLVRQAFLWALSGEEKKARVKALFKKICQSSFFGRIFGKISDERLDILIEDIYLILKKEAEAVPLATNSSPK